MRCLVIGARGSMGKRRSKYTKELGHEVIEWDILDGTKLPIADYDGIFVCTPPDRHEEYMNFKIPTFVEASILPYTPKRSEYLYPSCTMLFHPYVKYVRDQSCCPLAFTYHVGNYLPDWHPNEDYKTKYFAKRMTGGAREIIPYETLWMTSVWGPCEALSSEYFKLSKLDMDAMDYYRFSLGFDSGVVGSILVDVLTRPKQRKLTLIYEGDSKEVDMQNVDWEGIYKDETKAFIDAIKNIAKYPYSVQEDLWNLKLLSEIEFGITKGEYIE